MRERKPRQRYPDPTHLVKPDDHEEIHTDESTPLRQLAAAKHPAALTPSTVLYLQRTVGNQATMRLLAKAQHHHNLRPQPHDRQSANDGAITQPRIAIASDLDESSLAIQRQMVIANMHWYTAQEAWKAFKKPIGNLMKRHNIKKEIINNHLNDYDTNGKKFPSIEDFFKTLVNDSRGGISKDIQEMITKWYWKEQLEGLHEEEGKKFYQQIRSADYWKKEDSKISPKRPLQEIIDSVGLELLKEIESAGKVSGGKLKFYRSMPAEEAEAIMAWYKGGAKKYMEQALKEKKITGVVAKKLGWIMPISGHLGDEEQARKHLKGRKCLLEFILKKGAHLVLFNPTYMALAKKGMGVTAILNEYEKQKNKKSFPTAEKSQGWLSGYIGMNSENKGPFSLAISKPGKPSFPSRLLFQLFVQSIKVIKGEEHMKKGSEVNVEKNS